MTPFTQMTAAACPLGMANVDTDQLIPARFMQTPRSAGYGNFLLHDQRRDGGGALRMDFPLNKQCYAGAQILIASSNFGCGSSREAAVYTLADSGFRCVIASSFGDIFASNAAKNGLLAAVVTEAETAALLSDPDVIAGLPIHVDLAQNTIRTGSMNIGFHIREDRKLRLINGWSDVDLTMSYGQEIAAFLKRDRSIRPWAYPSEVAKSF